MPRQIEIDKPVKEIERIRTLSRISTVTGNADAHAGDIQHDAGVDAAEDLLQQT